MIAPVTGHCLSVYIKISENVQNKEGGTDISVSNKKLSSVTFNKSASKAYTVISPFNKAADPRTDTNSNGAQMPKQFYSMSVKLDIINIKAFTNFGEILSNCYQDIGRSGILTPIKGCNL